MNFIVKDKKFDFQSLEGKFPNTNGRSVRHVGKKCPFY